MFGANELFVRELLGMVEYAVEYGYFQPDRDLEWSRKIDPTSVTWERFLRNTSWRGETLSFGAAAERRARASPDPGSGLIARSTG
jgi:hypothetical protein